MLRRVFDMNIMLMTQAALLHLENVGGTITDRRVAAHSEAASSLARDRSTKLRLDGQEV